MTTQQISSVGQSGERPEATAAVKEDRPAKRAESQAQQAPASAAGNDVAQAELETPYLPDHASGSASERWQQIQAEFVDDPRKSVTEAHQLVSELTQRIVDAFAEERGTLERQWSKGDSVSTEDLRVCLQRYRAFFSRLLPSVKRLEAD